MNATRTNPADLWQTVIDSHRLFARVFSEFLMNAPNKIEVLRQALHGTDRIVALRAVPSLTVDEKKTLLPEWVHLARAVHSPFQLAWAVLESLPREWVLQNIEKEVDAILKNEEEDDYWMFLQLYARLDHRLMQKLAERAAIHSEPAIKELGEEWLAKSS